MDKNTIILIGPIGAGKTTLGRLLAERLGLPQVSMDVLRWDYYNEAGYDQALASEISKRDGLPGLYRYWKPFEIYAVERALGEHANCVIDFGAGHSVFEDEALFQRAQAALAPYPNVVLVLPSPDADETLAVLQSRYEPDADEEESITQAIFDLNEHFVRHPSNARLARIVVYTKDKTPEECCEEIIQAAAQ